MLKYTYMSKPSSAFYDDYEYWNTFLLQILLNDDSRIFQFLV